jgi:hypothetical protein
LRFFGEFLVQRFDDGLMCMLFDCCRCDSMTVIVVEVSIIVSPWLSEILYRAQDVVALATPSQSLLLKYR